jgi:hypothetical protein
MIVDVLASTATATDLIAGEMAGMGSRTEMRDSFLQLVDNQRSGSSPDCRHRSRPACAAAPGTGPGKTRSRRDDQRRSRYRAAAKAAWETSALAVPPTAMSVASWGNPVSVMPAMALIGVCTMPPLPNRSLSEPSER